MAAAQRIYLDANIIIETFEGGGPISHSLLRLLLSQNPSRAALATSELTLAEVLVGAYRDRNDTLVETYFGWLTANPSIEVGAVNRDALIGAALLRAQNINLKLADSIHIAIAIGMECSALMTADKKLSGAYTLTHQKFGSWRTSAAVEIVRPELAYIEALAGAPAP